MVREGFLKEEASGGEDRQVNEEKQAQRGTGISVNMGSEEQRVGVDREGQRGPLLNGRAASAERSRALVLCPRGHTSEADPSLTKGAP